jgi:glycosidase
MFCSIASDSDDNREHCRLDGLPDLAHEKAEVSDKLVEWLQWLQEEYDFDAFRVDAAVHMSKVSWRQEAACMLTT